MMSADVPAVATGPAWRSSQRLSGSLPYLTQRYALPIHGSASLRDSSGALQENSEQTLKAENTLRRKTPNGTLNAGYDGSAEDSNPQKHQLLPLCESIAYPSVHAPTPTKRTFLQHQQRQSSGHGLWPDQISYGWPPSQTVPQAQSAYSVMADSMLNQMPMQNTNPQFLYGQTVPSVIQPSFQHVGPTASGGQGSGPYGPYWHDGTYVPYRPAALRDPRFYYHAQGHWPGSLPISQLQHQAVSWQYNDSGPALWPQSVGHPTPIGQPMSSLSHQPAYAHRYSSGPRAADLLPPASRPRNTALLAEESLGIPDVLAEYGSSSSNGIQRDRIFAWALQQYRELLAFIHQSRRQQQQQGQPTNKPIFFPRPPKPTASGSSAASETRRAIPQSMHSVERSLAPPPLVRADTAPSFYGSGVSAGDCPAPSAWSLNGAQVQEDVYQRHVPQEQQIALQQHWLNATQQPPDRLRPLRRSSGSNFSQPDSQTPLDHAPASRAAVALSYMTKLCQDSDWQWTDGMHLGGCLAYGLGNYQKALRWYYKVLDADPKHLEATSNLAATLHMLGRKKEAEEFWMKVAKAAPNHFEAVEHLVGLLCNEHRSKEAISIIEYVERSLRPRKPLDLPKVSDRQSECSSSTASRSPLQSEISDKILYDFDVDRNSSSPDWREHPSSSEPGFGSSGFAIPGSDNGRILALIHAKGNMLYSLGDNGGAARAFEDAVLIATGRQHGDIQGLVHDILRCVTDKVQPQHAHQTAGAVLPAEPVLLTPNQALATAKLCFPFSGELPGIQHVIGGSHSLARKAAISTTSNSLLSLAKIFQDGMSNNSRAVGVPPLAHGVRDILALYYLSLSLQPSPSTANNVGILLASVQQSATSARPQHRVDLPGVVPGSGIALALQYYNYGLQLDQQHAHLYTNLGSLLKDIGQLEAAINMYERAVKCDGKFDIALANLANAVKDKGRISDAIVYYRQAVEVSPNFAEAVCGLANALNSVCSWKGRGGIAEDGGKRDRWHVDDDGMLLDARLAGASSSGWIKRVVDIVEKQLVDGESWGCGTLTGPVLEELLRQVTILDGDPNEVTERVEGLRQALKSWAGQKWEGARTTRLVERATKRISWHWYRDLYIKKRQRTAASYDRPQLPAALTVPTAPTVLPFHTFTCPTSAKQIRLISQRNGLRISVSTLRSPWLPKQVYPPPKPPRPTLRVGYVSSDFNNHPLAHLMQSVFGLHDRRRVEAYCYATAASDNSSHRQQIQNEAPVFHDVSSWPVERLVRQIVKDEIHILVNLNGYTRGARNEVFAARPAPIQMSFMGFAGTLGAEWNDYLLADATSIPPETLRPWRRNVDVEDELVDQNCGSENEEWVYGENIIYCRDTFFCCDHKQSAPDAHEGPISWEEEQKRRWQMRKELFPQITDDTVIFGNFNQLYKIEPTTFRTWLRILARVPNSILWLLRFPDLGESHLLTTARAWAGGDVASRVIFTDVAPKHLHISRARICDLVLDTPECNAHTTAADVLWSGTPLLTFPRYPYKMCSRMAASILKGALPKNEEGVKAGKKLIATSDDDYEDKAVALAKSLRYTHGGDGRGTGRLMELRKILYLARWTSALFDTKRWVRDLEDAYIEAFKRWVLGQGGDIWLDQIPRRTGASAVRERAP